MRTSATFFTMLLLAACGTQDEAAPAAGEEAQQPAASTVADFAGTWQVQSTLTGVADPVPSTLQGSADGSDWTLTLEGRPNIPLEVSMSGDSLVAVSEAYESVLREGVTVTVRTAAVIQDGTLVGKVLATYATEEGQEEVTGTLQGTRGSM